MKTSFLSIFLAIAGLSLSTANSQSSLFAMQDAQISSARNTRTSATPKVDTTMIWTPITLPFSEDVTIDNINGVLVDGAYLSRGFEITVTQPTVIDILCPAQWMYFSVYSDRGMENRISRGNSIFARLDTAGTYYLVVDDNAYKVFMGEYLTDYMIVFEDHNFENHKGYYSIDYSREFNETHPISGNLKDTVILPLGDHQNLIFISNDTAAYFDVEANSFYRITGNYSVSEGTGLSVAGFYVMPWVLDTAVTDVLTSGLYEGTDKFQITTIFTSTTAQKLRILPFAFSVGVSYNLTITKLSNVKTVPQVLDEAQEFTTFDMPYYDSADFGALPIVVMGDGSLIGNPEELPEQIYHAVARKVHLNQGDVLDITFSHSIGESVGYIFLYEKDGNKYNKIGEIGYGEDESGLVLTNPNIVYQADREIDLYIIGTTLYYFPIPYDDGYYTMSIFIPSAGIAALTQKGNIQIAPNPVRDKVTVTDLSGNETVSILDVGGRTVFSQAVAGKSLAMNVSHLNSGVYLLRIASPNGVYATKLIKQ